MRRRRCATRSAETPAPRAGLARLARAKVLKTRRFAVVAGTTGGEVARTSGATTLQVDAQIVPVAGLSHGPAAAAAIGKVDVVFGERVARARRAWTTRRARTS